MGKRMRAKDFDRDGYFCPDGEAKYSLLGHPIAIPAMVTYSGEVEHEEILLSAYVKIGDCPRCGERTTTDTLIFATNKYRMLKLLATFNSMDAAKVHGVIKGEIEKRGWTLDESEARVIGNPEEQFEFSLGLKQQQLEAMQCPNTECTLPIAAYGFDQASWRFLGEQEGEDADGKPMTYEDWGVEVPCPVCDHQVLFPPRDFELLVGTDFLEQYQGEVVAYRVIHPTEATEIVDARDAELGRMVT